MFKFGLAPWTRCKSSFRTSSHSPGRRRGTRWCRWGRRRGRCRGGCRCRGRARSPPHWLGRFRQKPRWHWGHFIFLVDSPLSHLLYIRMSGFHSCPGGTCNHHCGDAFINMTMVLTIMMMMMRILMMTMMMSMIWTVFHPNVLDVAILRLVPTHIGVLPLLELHLV